MATVAQVVNAALGKILVQAAEQPIQASEAQDFIFDMNNFMLDLDARGITLGYTSVSDLGDSLTVPDGAINGIIDNMAVVSAPRYGVQTSAELQRAASKGMQTLRILGQNTISSSFPSSFPRGMANSYDGYPEFYPKSADQIAAETNGNIELESTTNEVADG